MMGNTDVGRDAIKEMLPGMRICGALGGNRNQMHLISEFFWAIASAVFHSVSSEYISDRGTRRSVTD